jgi:hypothetical protein
MNGFVSVAVVDRLLGVTSKKLLLDSFFVFALVFALHKKAEGFNAQTPNLFQGEI